MKPFAVKVCMFAQKNILFTVKIEGDMLQESRHYGYISQNKTKRKVKSVGVSSEG